MENQSASRSFIKSLAKGLAVLEAFTPARPRLTLTELSLATGLNTPAVQRCTITLLELGYLRKNANKQYSLGPRVLQLGRAFLAGSDLRRLAGEHLRAFSRRIGYSVNLAVLEGADALIIFRHEVEPFFKYDVRVGTRLPGYCTSMGKILLAALGDQKLRELINDLRLERHTRYTITDPDDLFRNITAIRQSGLAICDREASLSLCSMAVPVLDHRGVVAAALNMSLPAGEVDAPELDDLSKRLLAQGGSLSGWLGYSGQYPVITVQKAN